MGVRVAKENFPGRRNDRTFHAVLINEFINVGSSRSPPREVEFARLKICDIGESLERVTCRARLKVP